MGSLYHQGHRICSNYLPIRVAGACPSVLRDLHHRAYRQHPHPRRGHRPKAGRRGNIFFQEEKMNKYVCEGLNYINCWNSCLFEQRIHELHSLWLLDSLYTPKVSVWVGLYFTSDIIFHFYPIRKERAGFNTPNHISVQTVSSPPCRQSKGPGKIRARLL